MGEVFTFWHQHLGYVEGDKAWISVSHWGMFPCGTDEFLWPG